MIVIVDYGMGNLGSIKNMFKKIGVFATITSDRDQIKNAKKIVLPGVGSFDEGMKNIERLGIDHIIYEKARAKTPILGICLGMQLLFKCSDEGIQRGLDLISGTVKKFDYSNYQLRIPHMGWNSASISKPNNALLRDLPADSRFYFVHSYYAQCNSENNVILKTKYGVDFHSGVCHNNIWGVQFHPEKSHKYGMKIFQNFSEL